LRSKNETGLIACSKMPTGWAANYCVRIAKLQKPERKFELAYNLPISDSSLHVA